MNAQLVPREEDRATLPTVLPAASTTPSQLLALAVQQGADLDRLERLMALQERWEANEARKAFVAAMAAFKGEPMTITKDKHVSFQTQKGLTEYDHATLGNVVRTVVAGLARHGLSHGWQTERMDGGRVKVICTITHCLGHSESIALDAPLDDSGGKNNIQSLGSAITYLQRYTLLSITGLATEDQDDDGKGAGGGFDITAWADAINGANLDTLPKIKADLVAAVSVPANERKRIVALYNARLRELKAK